MEALNGALAEVSFDQRYFMIIFAHVNINMSLGLFDMDANREPIMDGVLWQKWRLISSCIQRSTVFMGNYGETLYSYGLTAIICQAKNTLCGK
jgi:hypothetical protein